MDFIPCAIDCLNRARHVSLLSRKCFLVTPYLVVQVGHLCLVLLLLLCLRLLQVDPEILLGLEDLLVYKLYTGHQK